MLSGGGQPGGGTTYPASPVISGLSVAAGTGGQCSGSTTIASATLVVSWIIQGANPTQFQTLVYENGTLVSTLANNVTSWTKTITGYVQGLPGGFRSNFFTSNWVYNVQCVRISDSSVVGNLTAPAWSQVYGVCGS